MSCYHWGSKSTRRTHRTVSSITFASRRRLKPHTCCIAFTVDTPGFEVENRTKPAETKAIESFETTYKPQEVASAILDAVGNGEFHASCGDFGINMLVRGSSGMSPRANTMMDLLLLPLIGIVGFVYRYFWDREVQKYRREQRAAVSDAAAAATATEAGTGGAATTDPLLKPGQETTLYGVAADGAGAGHGKP